MTQIPQYAQFEQSYSTDPERHLWAAVLLLAIHDATDTTGCTQGEHKVARNWIGAYPTNNFCTVCMLANLDPDAVHSRLKIRLGL